MEGGARPSRARLTELEQRLPELEERVQIVARTVDAAERDVRLARADLLEMRGGAALRESSARQARIHELEPQLAAIQQEIYEHSRWIGNEGPVKIGQLEAEARRLRSEPA